MPEFKSSDGREALKAYFSIEKSNGDMSFSNFQGFFKKILRGDLLVLKNRFFIDSYVVTEEDRYLFVAQLFRPKYPSTENNFIRLGSIAVDKNLSNEKLFEITCHLKNLYRDQIVIGPWNGHMNLGFTCPDFDVPSTNLAFLETSHSTSFRKFFEQEMLKKERQYLALRTDLDPKLMTQLRDQLLEKPSHVQIRPISLWSFAKDMQIFNQLVNDCMQGHPRFEALEFQEFWQIFRPMRFLLKPEYFQFLYVDEKPVGFCFAVPDYNFRLRPRQDFINILRLLWTRIFVPRSVTRGRIIYSGILPEFRSKKIFKFVRNTILVEMYEHGIQQVISSYIDQDNSSSLGNVQSRGGVKSHSFFTYRL